MSDAMQELFERLEQTLASLEATFTALTGRAPLAAGAEPAVVRADAVRPPSDRRSQPRAVAGEATLTREEEERIVRQLRVLREEVRALGETLQHPPLLR